MNNPYRVLGLVLAIAGAVLAPIFYCLVNAVPLTAVALSMVMLGLTSALLANARPYISPSACQTLLRVGMENTAALLEELGVRSKAVYLPSSLRDGHPQALVPLAAGADIGRIREKLPGRLIVRYGTEAGAMAIAVTTAGGVNVEMLPDKPGPNADDIEGALNYILTGVLDIASGSRVEMVDSRVSVEINRPHLKFENAWYQECLGSPVGSIAAAVTSEALGKPVRIREESSANGNSRVELEVLA